MRTFALIALALLLGGCALNSTVNQELPLRSVTVSSSDTNLRTDFQNQLDQLELTGEPSITLTLNETTDNAIAARISSGSASKRRLSYALHYRIESTSGQSFSGAIRQKQTIDHSETTHLANRLAYKRFFESARSESIYRLISTLQWRDWQ